MYMVAFVHSQVFVISRIDKLYTPHELGLYRVLCASKFLQNIITDYCQYFQY